MEFLLNLVWMVLAVASFCLWVRHEDRKGADRYLPIVALVMLLVILFPVISVTDDLWSMQNPAETDTAVRRDQIAAYHHSVLPSLVAIAGPSFASMQTLGQRFRRTPKPLPVYYAVPALHAVENRPPPAA